MARRSSRRTAVCLAAALLAASGCGLHVDHDEVVRAASGGGTGATSGGDGTTVGGTASGSSSQSSPTGGDLGATGNQPGTAGGTGSTGSGSRANSTGSATTTTGSGTTSGGASGTATGSPIRIGNVGTYSGVAGPSFATGQEMLKVWVKWINARGGINGHPVVLYSGDDGGDPSKARALSQQMVEKDHVVAFVADMVPLTADAIGNYLDSAHVPAVGGDVSSPDWNEHEMLFPQGTGAFSLYDHSVFLDARFVKEAGGNKWGALYCAEDSVCPVWYQRANSQAPKAGLKPVYGTQVSLTQPSFTAQCLQAKNAGVQILELILDTNSIQRVARDCAAQGYNPFLATGALTVQSDVAKDPNVKRLVSIVPTFPWTLASGAAAGEYQQAIKTYDPHLNKSAATSAAWASAKLLEAALHGISKGATVSANDVLAGLYRLHDETLGGLTPRLNFVRGHPAPIAQCYFGTLLANGAWTPLNSGAAYC